VALYNQTLIGFHLYPIFLGTQRISLLFLQ
jgi:hypothetical protein